MGSAVQLMLNNLRRIADRFGTQERFAAALGRRQGPISYLLAGKRGWSALQSLEDDLLAAGIDPLDLVLAEDTIPAGGLSADEQRVIADVAAALAALPAGVRRLILQGLGNDVKTWRGLAQQLESAEDQVDLPIIRNV